MLGMNHVAALLENWAAEASALSNRYGQDGLALLTTRHIAELEQALREDADEPLTLTEASKVCGFTADHLGRLVRQEKLTNVGRKNAPRVRRGDLPRKSSVLCEANTDVNSSPRRRVVLAARSI